MRALVGCLVTLPVVALALASTTSGSMAWLGRDVWPPVTVTLPEAVATRDAGEVARQLALGVNPLIPATVRRGLIGDAERTITAYEAAVIRDDLQMWRLLLRAPVPLDGELVDRLRCLAGAADPAMRAALAAVSARPWPVCAPR